MKKNEVLDGITLMSILFAVATADDTNMSICFASVIVGLCCQIAKYVTNEKPEYYE